VGLALGLAAESAFGAESIAVGGRAAAEERVEDVGPKESAMRDAPRACWGSSCLDM